MSPPWNRLAERHRSDEAEPWSVKASAVDPSTLECNQHISKSYYKLHSISYSAILSISLVFQ